MKAIILARVSTEEQKEAGNSLPAQQARLRSYIERDPKLKLDREFIFDESAYKEHRAEFEAVVKYISSFKDVVAFCCDKVDRLTRDFLIGLPALETLRRQGKIELHFPSDNLVLHQDSPATDLFHFNIAVSLAQYYSNAISDNVKRANETKVRNGEWAGWAPIGYLNVEDEIGNKNIEIDPIRSSYIIRIFDLYATGNYSMRQIKDEMNKLGLKSKSKSPKPVSVSMINHILNNPFYYGMMRIKGNLHPHKYPHLIDKSLFDKAQSVSAGWHKKPFKYAAKPFIFRGLIKCAECGCTITPKTSKGLVYYSCTNYHKVHPKRLYVKEEALLAPIYELLDNIKLTDEQIKELTADLKQSIRSENRFFMNTVGELRKDYDKLENRISKLADDKYDGSITNDFYNKKFKEYTESQSKILADISKHHTADKEYHLTANSILSLAQRAREIFEVSEPAEKRQLLNYLLQNLELSGKKLLFKAKTPFDTVLALHNCSNWLPGSDSNRRPIGYTNPNITIWRGLSHHLGKVALGAGRSRMYSSSL